MALHKGFRYDHWSYDRIYRTDMIKQPDVLMFLYLYNSSFSKETKRVNYDFYEPRTIHESSLSPAIYSIFGSGAGQNGRGRALLRLCNAA